MKASTGFRCAGVVINAASFSNPSRVDLADANENAAADRIDVGAFRCRPHEERIWFATLQFREVKEQDRSTRAQCQLANFDRMSSRCVFAEAIPKVPHRARTPLMRRAGIGYGSGGRKRLWCAREIVNASGQGRQLAVELTDCLEEERKVSVVHGPTSHEIRQPVKGRPNLHRRFSRA